MASLSFALDHRWAPPRMSAYLEGDMGSRQRSRLERHIARCPICARKLRVLRDIVAGLQRLRREDPATPDDFTRQVLDRLGPDPGPAARDGPPG